MHRPDNSKASLTVPTRAAVGPNPNGHFVVSGGVGTTLDPDWAEAITNEVVEIIEDAGLTLDKTDDTQLKTAIGILCDVEYIPLTSGTVALTQTATATYTYNIADFVGTDLDTDQIRTLHISAQVDNTDDTTFIYATMPDSTEIAICGCGATGGGDAPDTPILVPIPINKTQAASGSIDLRIVTNAGNATYTILGATQRTFV